MTGVKQLSLRSAMLRQGWIALLAGALLSAPGHAVEVDYSITGFIDYTQLNIDRQKFLPHMTRVKFGATLADTAAKGVGIELVAGVPVTDDEVDDVTAELSSYYGVFINFVDYESKDLRLGVSLGYTATDIDVELETNGYEFGDTYESGSFAFSLQDTIGPIKNTYWVFECMQHFKVGDVKMAGCGLGVKYDF